VIWGMTEPFLPDREISTLRSQFLGAMILHIQRRNRAFPSPPSFLRKILMISHKNPNHNLQERHITPRGPTPTSSAKKPPPYPTKALHHRPSPLPPPIQISIALPPPLPHSPHLLPPPPHHQRLAHLLPLPEQ